MFWRYFSTFSCFFPTKHCTKVTYLGFIINSGFSIVIIIIAKRRKPSNIANSSEFISIRTLNNLLESRISKKDLVSFFFKNPRLGDMP